MFEGSNVRTKSGKSAIDLYEEISNAPASFTAARTALACAVLKRHRVTFRDAAQAYLQASISGPGRISTWVELPVDWWPDSWFHDGSKRGVPMYKRPVVKLLQALYGHPESGALLENYLKQALGNNGWQKIYEWPGVFHHSDGSVIVAYVDDILLTALPGRDSKHWLSIEDRIVFKDPAQPIAKYLGATHCLQEVKGDMARVLDVTMIEYSRNMTSKFQEEYGRSLKPVLTPYPSDKDWSAVSDKPGVFASTCASHVASALFLGRVGRPDISTAVQRLCTMVSKWTVTEDAALIRLMSYVAHNAAVKLTASLSPADLSDLVLNLYTDADWAGDPTTTKSTTEFGWSCLAQLQAANGLYPGPHLNKLPQLPLLVKLNLSECPQVFLQMRSHGKFSSRP